MSEYYDGNRLLSMMDINGNKPEIFMCSSNRSAGKTTFFNRRVFKRWLDYGEKFCLVYRFNYELDDVADKFFKDIGALFFSGVELVSKKKARGMYVEIYRKLYEEQKPEEMEVVGYAVALNNADAIKKLSHLLSDCTCMLMDEFQSETGHYCANEVEKLMSVHTSLARGRGQQVKYLPIYMISNPVSILNPYYTALGIAERLRDDTKMLRGDGFVLEVSYNNSVAEKQQESAFNRAFKNESYTAYAGQGVYLKDNKAFIEKPEGFGNYLATIKADGCEYAILEYRDLGLIYVSDKVDYSFKFRISVTLDDHSINYVMLKSNEFFIGNMRYLFDRGCFRFKNLKCKSATLKLLSY